MRITRAQLRKIIRECGDEMMAMPDGVHGMEIDWEGDMGAHGGRALGSGGSAEMARGQLFVIAQKAQSLYDRLSDEDELPEWVQSKIGTMDDYMGVIDDYLGYKMHRYDSGDPLPAYESLRRRVRKSLHEEEDKTVSTGVEAKGGQTVDKAEALLKKIPGLENILKQVDTKDEITNVVQALVQYVIQTGGVDQAEVNAALTNAAAAAKKA